MAMENNLGDRENAKFKETDSGETAVRVIMELSDHGALDGLADDDHPQYSLISSGTTPPGGAPSRVGLTYIDTVSDVSYVSVGTETVADWKADIPEVEALANGMAIENITIVATSDGVNAIVTVEKNGGGDFSVIMDAMKVTIDSTPALTAALSTGSDSAPVRNYVYLNASQVLEVSTVGFPTATTYIPLADIICQSAASVQADGVYKNHKWEDHTAESNDLGHVSHINAWIRSQHATWLTGGVPTVTITSNGGAVDNVNFASTSGTALQLHDHAFPAFDMAVSTKAFVINDSVAPYVTTTDLNAQLTDSAGNSLSGSRFCLVLWTIVSEDTGDCKLMCNLPNGSYNTDAGAIADSDKTTNYNIPTIYKGTGILLARLVLRHQVAAGGTWTEIETTDLRGQFPSTFAGGTASVTSVFADGSSGLKVFNSADSTKEFVWDASLITAETQRVVSIPDGDGTLAYASGLTGGQTISGDTAASGNLTLSSTSHVTKGDVISADPFCLPNGTIGALALKFTNDNDSGFYFSGTDAKWDMVAGGFIAVETIKAASASYANIGVGGAANAFKSYIVEARRDFTSGTLIRSVNVNGGAAAGAGFYALAGSGGVIDGQLMCWPAAATTHAYTSRFVMRTANTASGISIAAGVAATDIRFYAGGLTSSNLIATVDSIGLGIGKVAASPLDVDQSSSTAAIPVMTLKQTDISEEMMELDGTTIGTGNAIEAIAAKILTATHFVKVTITGVGTRYIPVGTIA